MRRMRPGRILVFLLLAGVAFALSILTTWQIPGRLPRGGIRGVVLSVFGVGAFYLFAIKSQDCPDDAKRCGVVQFELTLTHSISDGGQGYRPKLHRY
jgi:hypothetical protein